MKHAAKGAAFCRWHALKPAGVSHEALSGYQHPPEVDLARTGAAGFQQSPLARAGLRVRPAGHALRAAAYAVLHAAHDVRPGAHPVPASWAARSRTSGLGLGC